MPPPQHHVLGLLSPLMLASAGLAQDYTLTRLGAPDGASSAIGVRMNNLGQVAGWSSFPSDPRVRGWVWTPGEGFTVLPPLPGDPTRPYRAMDISDTGIVGGDGGFDSGLAFRYEDGVYEFTGAVDGLPIAYLGGINNNGDLTGTAKDASISTPDRAFVDINGGPLLNITPDFQGRGVDINDAGQVAGYAGFFEAFRWSDATGVELLGTLGQAFSYATGMNERGDVVGYARSGSGNTNRAWVYTDDAGMVRLTSSNSSFARAINDHGHVVGTIKVSGPDFVWLWTGGPDVVGVETLLDARAENVNVLGVSDINNRGQILLEVFDNAIAELRYVIITPPDAPCRADFDGDGELTLFDFLAFQNAFGMGDPRADFDGDGALTLFDFLAFQNEFDAGCP